MIHYDLVIATPGGSFKQEYVESLVRTMDWASEGGMRVQWLNKVSSFVPSARELTATNTFVHNWDTNTIGSGEFTYTWLLWIDSDVSWNPEDIERLMNHDLDVVGGVYRTNQDGTIAVAFDNGSGLPRKVNEVELILEEDPIEVWGIGFGFLLVKHGVMETMKRPWFEIEKIRWPEHDFDTNVGEDYSWCIRARRAGFKVMVDPKVKVGHTKETIFQVR